MIYFGNPSTDAIRTAMETRTDLGAIITPAQGNKVPQTQVIIDNGCFTQPDKFQPAKYRQLCEQHQTAIFATIPDTVANWQATLEQWHDFDRTDWPCPLAIVLQDGAKAVDIPWHETAAIFIGGTTEWKLSQHAAALATAAHKQNKWVHMGRVNSYKRLHHAHQIGCHSADGTMLVYGPDINLKRLTAWLTRINTQPSFA